LGDVEMLNGQSRRLHDFRAFLNIEDWKQACFLIYHLKFYVEEGLERRFEGGFRRQQGFAPRKAAVFM
jgi:hypothetical protein